MYAGKVKSDNAAVLQGKWYFMVIAILLYYFL